MSVWGCLGSHTLPLLSFFLLPSAQLSPTPSVPGQLARPQLFIFPLRLAHAPPGHLEGPGAQLAPYFPLWSASDSLGPGAGTRVGNRLQCSV